MSLPVQVPSPDRTRRASRLRRAALLFVVSCAVLFPSQADAQADGEADQQADKRADKQANKQVNKQANKQSDRQEATQPGAGSGAVSPAETLLFETDHLAHVALPAVLVYTFRKTSNVEPGFSDEVRLDLAAGKGAGESDTGAKDAKGKRKMRATLHFLSGAHAHEVPALEEAHGNPVLLGFLERDIAEMSRLTGGSAAYFRKRIRMALAEHARVEVQSITWQGKSLPARMVRIQPYLDDPMHARFERYVHKTYTFVFSERVPGELFQLRSSLGDWDMAPDMVQDKAQDKTQDRTRGRARNATVVATTAPAQGSAAAPPAIDETLTLTGVTHPRQ
nr:hypothetical protein [uncultured Massilia sp.]